MIRIIVFLLCLIGTAYGQSSPTSAKTRFVNGLYIGTKLDSYFAAADSNALYWRADSVVMAKYKGTARALAFDVSGGYVPYTGATQNVTIGNYRLSARTLLGDSVMARGSGGVSVYANNGTQVALFGAGGGSSASFYGFAGYDANRSASYTARSFTDKGYVDSSIIPYNTTSISNRPVFIDQFVSNFYGRGMLTSEPINTVTEQLIGSNYAAGVDNIRVADTSKFKVGGLATIKHTNGLYETYFITSKGGDDSSGTIGIQPALKYSVTTASLIERTWFNKAHPGKFYMRQLAQQIANGTEINTAIPTGNRILYTNFSDTPSLSKDTLTALGGSSVSYFAASNTGVDAASPIRFILGNTPYISIASAGDGAETPLFYIDRPAQSIASIALSSSNNANAYSIQIINDSGRAVAVYKIPTTASKKAFTIYKFPFVVSLSNKLKVRVVADTVTAPANLSIAQIDVFEQSSTNKKIIAKQNSVIVGLGDSWMAGDLGSTTEREPITQQLALELPYATIINAGVGGNTINDMLNRFDTDVAPYNPDYVIIETGTNDCYNPPSSIFYPNGVNDWLNTYNQLIHKVLAIGAKPIIVGVPALSQTDADVPSFPEWLLNDRARLYAQKFYRYLSKQTSEGGHYEWKLNVSDTASMLDNYQRKTSIIPTSQGGTGRTTWTAGTIPVIGSGTGNPFVDLNNRFFFDSSSRSLMVGGNTRYYNAQLNLGVFNVPKITLAQTDGYRWSTYVDSLLGKYRIRYEEGALEPLILDRLGNTEVTGNLTTKKILGGSSAPSVTLGANITGSVAVTGTDMAGTITVTVTAISSLATLNELFTLTYNSAYASTPNVVFSPASPNAAAIQNAAGGLYLKNSGTSSFQIATVNSYTTPASATYSFTYHVIQ